MALAPVAYTLWQNFLRFNPDDPAWPNRDRFVLSAGHASMLLYSLLHLTGYPDMTLDELKRPTINQSRNLRSIVDRVRPSIEPLLHMAAQRDSEALVREAVAEYAARPAAESFGSTESKMLFHPRPERPTEPNAGLVRYEPGSIRLEIVNDGLRSDAAERPGHGSRDSVADDRRQ